MISEETRPFPILKTSRLTLREITPADDPQIFENFSNLDVMRFYDSRPITLEEEGVKIRERLQQQYYRNRGIRWAITLTEQDKLLGTIGFHTLKKKIKKAEIGYELHPDFWKQGIMSEAIRPVIAHGFGDMQFNRIEARIVVGNYGSAKAAKNNGFQSEGVLRQVSIRHGQYEDMEIFSILKEEWNSNQTRSS